MPGATLTWLGQAGFLLEVADTRILIDPFLSEHEGRLHPAPDAASVGRGLDWLLISHGHLDHFDPASIRALAAHSPTASLVVPSALADPARELDVALRVLSVEAGQRLSLSASVHLLVTPAWHAVTPAEGYWDGRGADGLEQFVGYVIQTPDIAIYHSGDTLATDGLRTALSGERIDVALLPVNGRDERREGAGIVGNMDGPEAVALAQEIGVEVLVPMHWDLIDGNTADPGAVVSHAAARDALHVVVPARLRPLHLAARPRAASAADPAL